MFKRKQKIKEVEEQKPHKVKKEKAKLDVDINKKNDDVGFIESGTRTLKDFIAPPSFDRSHEDYMMVGNKYVRNFIMQGYPSSVQVGWLDQLYNYEGDMDTAIYIEPADDRQALDELTNKITQFESQLQIENEKGRSKIL